MIPKLRRCVVRALSGDEMGVKMRERSTPISKQYLKYFSGDEPL